MRINSIPLAWLEEGPSGYASSSVHRLARAAHLQARDNKPLTTKMICGLPAHHALSRVTTAKASRRWIVSVAKLAYNSKLQPTCSHKVMPVIPPVHRQSGDHAHSITFQGLRSSYEWPAASPMQAPYSPLPTRVADIGERGKCSSNASSVKRIHGILVDSNDH